MRKTFQFIEGFNRILILCFHSNHMHTHDPWFPPRNYSVNTDQIKFKSPRCSKAIKRAFSFFFFKLILSVIQASHLQLSLDYKHLHSFQVGFKMAIKCEHHKLTKLLFYRRFYIIAYILFYLVLNVIIDTF